jgi:hypothetical protein
MWGNKLSDPPSLVTADIARMFAMVEGIKYEDHSTGGMASQPFQAHWACLLPGF